MEIPGILEPYNLSIDNLANELIILTKNKTKQQIRYKINLNKKLLQNCVDKQKNKFSL